MRFNYASIILLILWLIALHRGEVYGQEIATPVVLSQNGLGGIYNVRLAILDTTRFYQLYGGDTVRFQFWPADLHGTQFLNTTYTNQVLISSRRYGDLSQFFVDYGKQLSDRCDSLGIENGSLIAGPIDSNYVTRYIQRDDGSSYFSDRRGFRRSLKGSFQGDPKLSIYGVPTTQAGIFSIGFDYSFIQCGDSLRFGEFGDTLLPYKQLLNPYMRSAGDVNIVPGYQYTGGKHYKVSDYLPLPSWGQPKIEIEFLPGGMEKLTYVLFTDTIAAMVPYLNMRVRNIAQYIAQQHDSTGREFPDTVHYDYEYPLDPAAAVKSDTNHPTSTPLAIVIDPASFGLYAAGWQDRPEGYDARRSVLNRSKSLVRHYLGTPGRYYLSIPSVYGIDGKGATHSIAFSHLFLINGSSYLFDGAGMGSVSTGLPDNQSLPVAVPTTEFQAGDKVILNFVGGTLGLPQPGATVTFAIPATSSSVNVEEAGERTGISITSIAPNPSSSNVDLDFHLGHEGYASIKLLAADGNEFMTVGPVRCSSGHNRILLNSGDLPAGLYFCQLICNGSIATKAVVLVR